MTAPAPEQERPALAGLSDPTERLGPDDMATRREEQFLDAALRHQRQQAAGAPSSTPGTCCNCGQACLPRAVYCDEDCRADHEHRLRLERRR